MPTTYTLINSNVLSSSAASVTFSAIPATYTDLVLRISARTDNAGTDDGVNLTINSTAGTAYSRTFLYGDGATATSGRTASTSRFSISPTGVNGNTTTANTFGNAEIYIPSYLISQNKPIGYFGAYENNATTAKLGAYAGLWQNTAAITQLDLTPSTGTNFLSTSSFYLYGISNA